MSNKITINSLIILSILTLSVAYFIEFVLGHEPCSLCKIERIPYIGAIILGSFLILTNKWKKIILFLILLLFVFGTIISIYHVGIEQNIFSESLLCEIGVNNNIKNPDELLKTLGKTPISCKDVTFKIFGLSLATFNTILSIVISCILLRQILKK